MKLVNKMAVLVIGGLLGYYCVFCLEKQMTFGQTVNTNECSNESENKCITVTIFSDSSILRKGEPFPVTIEIENISDKPFRLKSFPRIVLLKEGVVGQDKEIESNSYKSIVYLDSESQFVKKKVLEKGEKIEFKINITDLGWGNASLSYYPADDLFELVPQGEYELYSEMLSYKFENNREIVVRIPSNTIKVSVK